MNIRYTTQINIHADMDTTWQAITHESFTKDFLPEVKRNTQGMSEYIQTTHKNSRRVSPSYVIPGRAVSWNANLGTVIRLTRKDIHAQVETVEIRLEEQGAYTKVMLNVDYQHKLGRGMILAFKCIRGLFKIKLSVLKKELEMDHELISCAQQFAFTELRTN